MAVLSAVMCPVCGGPFHKVETNCPYCGVMVVISGDHRRIDASRLDRGVINERIREYRAALKKDFSDAEARYGLGVAYYNLGLIDEAIEELQQAAKLMPENPHIHVQLGVVLYEVSNARGATYLAQAWKHLDRTLLLEPRNEEGLVLKEALLRQRLRTAESGTVEFNQDRHDLSATWHALASVNGERVRPLITNYLRLNQATLKQLPAVKQQFGSSKPLPNETRQTWFLRTLGWSIGVFIVFILLGAAAVSIWGDENGDIDSGAGNAVVTILVLLAIIAPIVLMIRGYRRRPAKRLPATPSNASNTVTFDPVTSVLAEDTPIDVLLELTDAVLAHQTHSPDRR